MFVSKRKYEELERKLRNAEDKCLVSESIRKDVEEKLEKYESNKHKCDAMCEGCQNLIESTEWYVPEGLYGGLGCPRERTTRRCALDRTCKDFKADDTKKSEGEKNE